MSTLKELQSGRARSPLRSAAPCRRPCPPPLAHQVTSCQGHLLNQPNSMPESSVLLIQFADASVLDTSQSPHAQASVPGAPMGMPYDRLRGCQGARLTAAPPAIVQPGQIHGAYSQHLCSTQGVDKLKSHPPAAAGPTPGSWSSSCCSICREELTEGGEHAAACLKCGHTFGEACIRQWMSSCRKACPLCQAK